jgi:hypothetical protein
MRISKPLIAAALAISMTGTPVLAQSAASLSIAARSGAATTHTNQQFDNPRFLPALVIIAVLAAAILLVRHHHPASP